MAIFNNYLDTTQGSIIFFQGPYLHGHPAEALPALLPGGLRGAHGRVEADGIEIIAQEKKAAKPVLGLGEKSMDLPWMDLP